MAVSNANAVTGLLDTLDEILEGFVNGSFTNLASPIELIWKAMFVVVVASYGYKILITGRFSGADVILMIGKMLIILVVATQWSQFQLFVMNVIVDTPSQIAGIVISETTSSSGRITSANTALGKFFDDSVKAYENIIAGSGWNPVTKLYGFLVLGAALVITGLALGYIALSKVAVAVLLALAPFFILMLAFKQTASLFDGWLRQTLNYAFIPMIVYAILAIIISLASKPLTELLEQSSSKSELVTYVVMYLLACSVSLLLLRQVQQISSGITGGISLSAMGLEGYVGKSGLKFGGYSSGQIKSQGARGIKAGYRQAKKVAGGLVSAVKNRNKNKI